MEVVAHGLNVPAAGRVALEQTHEADWIEQRRYNCDGEDNLPGQAITGRADVHPDTIVVGYGMIQPGCGLPRADLIHAGQAEAG